MNQPTFKIMPTLKYYAFLVLALPIAFVKGVWTGLASIPTYVSAQINSTIHTAREVRKNQKTGTTPRQRRIDAIKPNQPEK